MVEAILLVLGIAAAGLIAYVSVFKRGFLLWMLTVYAFLPIRTWTGKGVPLPLLGNCEFDSILAAGMMAIMLIRLSVGPGVERRCFDKTSLSWLFCLTAVTYATASSITGDISGFKMLVRLGYPLLVYLLVTQDCRDERDVKRLIGAVTATGALATVLTFLLPNIGMPIWKMSGGVDRLLGLGAVSSYAFLMGILSIISYARFREIREKKSRLVSGGLFIAFSSQLLMTVTRGAILGTGLALMAYECFGRRERPGSRLVAILAITMMMSLTLAAYGPFTQRMLGLNHDGSSGEYVGVIAKITKNFEHSDRARVWEYMVDTLSGDYHIITGYGLGRAEMDVQRKAGYVPHNEYLRVSYEMGLIGLPLFLASLAQIFYFARRYVKWGSCETTRLAAGICVSILVLYSVGALLDNMFNKYKYMGAFLFMHFALATAMQNRTEKKEGSHALQRSDLDCCKTGGDDAV